MQSVLRAVGVTRFVAGSGAAGCRLADVARAQGLHKASASRLLATLVAAGVVERTADRRFRLADDFRDAIGVGVSTDRLRRLARPSLARIAGVTGDAAFLSVRSGYDALCVDRQVGAHPIQALSLDVGARRPLGVGAGSLALFAWQPEAERREVLQARHRVRYPAFDVPTVEHLAKRARTLGFTEIRDLVVPGMTGIGVPVRDRSGMVVAALSVAAISARLDGSRRTRAVDLLLAGSREVERRLGGAVHDDPSQEPNSGSTDPCASIDSADC
ncbi:MAG: IclR family transcriptional regulator [Pseudomonadota bacterium]